MSEPINEQWGKAAHDARDTILNTFDEYRDGRSGAANYPEETNASILLMIALAVSPDCPAEFNALAKPGVLIADGEWGDAATAALANLRSLPLDEFRHEPDDDEDEDERDGAGD